MHVADLFDLEALEKHVADGMVKVQTHPTLDLDVYNYSHQCQWAQAWDEITTQCRGLIVRRSTGVVVARPFRKFFNWDQSQVVRIPIGPMIKMPKMDGSLGVLYPADDGWAIATRGSFVSDQALRGTALLREDEFYSELDPQLGKTYLFEIIYPENRIVVDYRGWSGLVLLDVIDNETGKADLAEFDNVAWLHKVEREARKTFDHTLVQEIGDDEEGFVLYWPFHDLRVKLKGPEYVRLHRILTGVSTKTIWEYLSQRRKIEELIENVPDEFYTWVSDTAAGLQARFNALEGEIRAEYRRIDRSLPAFPSRKDFAELACRSPHRAALFRILDGAYFDDYVWKLLKPEFERPFTAQSEDVA